MCGFLALKDRKQVGLGAFDEHAQKGILGTDTREKVTYTRDGGHSGMLPAGGNLKPGFQVIQ